MTEPAESINVMQQVAQTQILAAEEQLRQAMLDSDIATLEALLAPELIFTNHLGQRVSLQDDLDAHRSGQLQIHTLTLSEQQVHTHGDMGVVSVRAQIAGIYAGQPANGDFRFTRVWALTADRTAWRVVAAHSGLVV
ncbi:nuclear transport factor 2 family protein [Silvimonas soli]|uniref:nuclear transport factor 2 family protein n=1 Tax=Silvimonas soli TaxID=2980100 RepID=UPI0024B3547A|nr:nuclear transport factor 2 family protein [Silvimonas soli]